MIEPDRTDGSWPEALLAGCAGTLLAAWAARRVGLRGGARAALAGVSAINGVIGGRRGVYDWFEPEGLAAFALDSTWSLPNTGAGLVVHAVQAAHTDADYRPELSQRRNRHVYGGGFAVRKGFVFTQGNVISSAGHGIDLSADDKTALRRRLLLERHENLHVWQARWFGPAYAPLYVGWMAVGAAIGFTRWLRRHDASLFEHLEAAAYYENPFERWAYSADDNWPPAALNRLHNSDRKL